MPDAGREAAVEDVPEVVDAYREVGCTCGDPVVWCPLHTPSPEATRTKPMPDHLSPPARESS